jgi:KaiC/GvpD/RAD55 family RecA-like ATPase
MERLNTGVPALDQLIDGGYPKGRSILIMGGPGSGKTILGLSFIKHSCSSGLKALYVATEETPDDLILQAESFGWDLNSYIEQSLLRFAPVTMNRSDDAEFYLTDDLMGGENLVSQLLGGIRDFEPEGYDVMVIDNLGTVIPDVKESLARKFFDLLCHKVTQDWGLTGLIVIDEAVQRYSILAMHTTYGTLRLYKDVNAFNGNHERYIEIKKMRSTAIPDNPFRFSFSKNGIQLMS